MADNVNHPAHYVKDGRKECIVEMEEKFGPLAVYWFSVLSAYKYRYREGDKPGNSAEQDEAKAEWYDAKSDEMIKKHTEQYYERISKKPAFSDDWKTGKEVTEQFLSRGEHND